MIVRAAGGDVVLREWAGEHWPARGDEGGWRAGVSVSPSTVSGVPAVTAAVSRAAFEVSRLRLRVWRGDGFARRQVKGSWQARLLRGPFNPVQTVPGFFEALSESVDYRGNGFVWKQKLDGRVSGLWCLHPDQVSVERDRRSGRCLYRVLTADGWVDPEGVGAGKQLLVDADSVLHVRGFGDGGALLAPSPIARHQATLGAGVAREEYSSAFFENGTTAKLAISFPKDVHPDQVKAFQETWNDKATGLRNSHRARVVGGGATITPINLSMVDAQFVEAQRLGVEDVARIFNVPASLIDAGHSGSVPLSPEHELQRWIRYGLSPRLTRIEAAFGEDPDLFGPGSGDVAAFDMSDVLHGDLEAMDRIAHQQVQDGRILVDEWRESTGREPLPGGVGKIPQIVPVGGAKNPVVAGVDDGVE